MAGSSSHPRNIEYEYRSEGRRQAFYRKRPATTAPRPNLHQYWQSFVSNLPTFSPLSWNITNPIGNFFHGNAEQVIESPVIKPHKRKRKTSDKHKIQKPSQINDYYTAYDHNYHHHMHLQPLGLDHNKVMHFYEPLSGQYYALQVESQPNYYNSHYDDSYNNNPYGYNYNQYNNYGGYYEENNSGSEDGYYNQNNEYNSQHGHKDREADQQHYTQNSEYNSKFSDYDDENESNEEANAEYDDGVELADNWDYNDEDIFADRKLKGGSNKLNAFAERIIKIQKHLLKPETKEEAQHLLSKHQINTHKDESTKTKNKPVRENEESVRNAMKKKANHKSMR